MTDQTLVYRLRKDSARGLAGIDAVASMFSTSDLLSKEVLDHSTVLPLWVSTSIVATGPADLHDALGKLADVELVHPDYEYHLIDAAPRAAMSDVEILQPQIPWHHEWLQISKIREDYNLTGKGCRVGVLDSGIDPGSRLNAKLRKFAHVDQGGIVNETSPREPGQLTHGTHVCGSIAADDYGIAPDAELYVASVNNGPMGLARWSQINAGIQWLLSHDVHVINMSLGGPGHRDDLDEALDACRAHGVAVIAAVGNLRPGKTMYPGNSSKTFSVGAFDVGGKLIMLSGSEAGQPFAVAPGAEIYSTLRGDGVGAMTGTSQATPQVTGLFALLREYAPDAPSAKILEALSGTCQALPGVPLANQGRGSIQPLTVIDSFTQSMAAGAGAGLQSDISEVYDGITGIELYLSAAEVELRASAVAGRCSISISDTMQSYPFTAKLVRKGNMLCLWQSATMTESNLVVAIETDRLDSLLAKLTAGALSVGCIADKMQLTAVAAPIKILPAATLHRKKALWAIASTAGPIDIVVTAGNSVYIDYAMIAAAADIQLEGDERRNIRGAGTIGSAQADVSIKIRSTSGAVTINQSGP